MCIITLNNELKGIELSFKNKPGEETLRAIKLNGFRWHNVKKIWYAKQSDQTLKFANSLKELETSENSNIIAEVKKSVKKRLSLWERVQFVEGNTKKEDYDYKFVGSNYSSISFSDLLKIIRNHVKERFPEVKFSIRQDKGGYTKSIIFNIVSSPYEKNSDQLKAIKEYCTKLLKSYNYSDSDSMTDYFDVGFYGDRANIYYDYKQTEQTESIKADIEDFNKQEEEREEKEFKAYIIEQKAREEERKVREEEHKKELEIINNNVVINNVLEEKCYYVNGCKFANLNKNNTLDEYIEEVKKGEYTTDTVKITREITFNNAESLELFKNNLLSDFDFIKETGGSYTDDKRINSMIDFHNMTKEERETVDFNRLGIAVYYNNQLQFVIDSQGYSYARYIGITDESTIENEFTYDQILTDEEIEIYKRQAGTVEDLSFNIIVNNNLINTWNNESWSIYKELLKQELKNCSFKLNNSIIQQIKEEELKIAMYRLLVEIDGIQDQFSNANLQQGQKVTLFYIGEFGGLITNHITIDNIENSSYAQYKNAVKVTYKRPRKRGSFYKYFYSDMLLYDGWEELPKDLLYDISESNGFIISQSKYSSCDKKQYDAIIEYLSKQNKHPLVNTYKPI